MTGPDRAPSQAPFAPTLAVDDLTTHFFTKAGVVDFACLLPGHYEAGMKGAIKVGRK